MILKQKTLGGGGGGLNYFPFPERGGGLLEDGGLIEKLQY